MRRLLTVDDDPSRTRAAWDDFSSRRDQITGYLALVDGEPVSAGGLAIATTGRHGILSGGATRPELRGRGCYAALVRHRWHVAQSLGLDALVVQASPLSRPVLERLGFAVAGTLRVLADSAQN
jgi:GNAT superfamily N-acetyltransferase